MLVELQGRLEIEVTHHPTVMLHGRSPPRGGACLYLRVTPVSMKDSALNLLPSYVEGFDIKVKIHKKKSLVCEPYNVKSTSHLNLRDLNLE